MHEVPPHESTPDGADGGFHPPEPEIVSGELHDAPPHGGFEAAAARIEEGEHGRAGEASPAPDSLGLARDEPAGPWPSGHPPSWLDPWSSGSHASLPAGLELDPNDPRPLHDLPGARVFSAAPSPRGTLAAAEEFAHPSYAADWALDVAGAAWPAEAPGELADLHAPTSDTGLWHEGVGANIYGGESGIAEGAATLWRTYAGGAAWPAGPDGAALPPKEALEELFVHTADPVARDVIAQTLDDLHIGGTHRG